MFVTFVATYLQVIMMSWLNIVESVEISVIKQMGRETDHTDTIQASWTHLGLVTGKKVYVVPLLVISRWIVYRKG